MKLPPYVYRDKDRQGRTRLMFRRKGVNRTIKHAPSSDEFWSVYHDLMGGKEPEKPLRQSFTWLVNLYLKALEKKSKDGTASPLTFKQRNNQLRRLCKEHDPNGKKDAFALDQKKVRQMLADLLHTPGEANNTRKAIRAMYSWAIDEAGICDFNPTDGVKPIKTNGSGFAPWSIADVRKFTKYYPLGTQQYLAVMLALFTGARRSDLPKIGPANLKDGVISFAASKAGASSVSVPVHPQLQEAIDFIDIPNAHAYLATQYGKPRSIAGLGNWFGQSARDAGLLNRTLHGLRKSQAEILAELGATQYEIMAIQGHTNAKTSEIYTKGANRKTLANSGMERLKSVRI